MTNLKDTATELKGTISGSYGGAIIGGILGWALAKSVGYEKSISVVSFTIVGIIVGASLGYKIKSK